MESGPSSSSNGDGDGGGDGDGDGDTGEVHQGDGPNCENGTIDPGEYCFEASPIPSLAPGAMAAADFDGDGNLDLVSFRPFDGDVQIALGNGAGGFGSPQILAVEPSLVSDPYVTIHVGNFHGDALL